MIWILIVATNMAYGGIDITFQEWNSMETCQLAQKSIYQFVGPNKIKYIQCLPKGLPSGQKP